MISGKFKSSLVRYWMYLRHSPYPYLPSEICTGIQLIVSKGQEERTRELKKREFGPQGKGAFLLLR